MDANKIAEHFAATHNSTLYISTKREFTYGLFIFYMNKWLEEGCPESLFYNRNVALPDAFPAFIAACLKATNSEAGHLESYDARNKVLVETNGANPFFNSMAEMNAALENGAYYDNEFLRDYVANYADGMDIE